MVVVLVVVVVVVVTHSKKCKEVVSKPIDPLSTHT